MCKAENAANGATLQYYTPRVNVKLHHYLIIALKCADIYLIDLKTGSKSQAAAYEILNNLNTVDFVANYLCPGDVFHDITVFRMSKVAEIPNTDHKIHNLSYHRQRIVQRLPTYGTPKKYSIASSDTI